MHVGKLVFAQLMDHLPWKTFGRIVERYGRIGRRVLHREPRLAAVDTLEYARLEQSVIGGDENTEYVA